MKNHSEESDDLLRTVLGLGPRSLRKTHYPSLRSRLAELERLRTQLERSEAYLSEAQRLSHTGSFGLSAATGEMSWSEETFRVFEYESTIKPTLDLAFKRFHPDDIARVRQIFEQASKDAKDFDHEHRLRMPDGRVKWLHVRARAVTDSSGGVEFIGAVTDITERKRAEEALRRSEAYLAESQRLTQTGSFTYVPGGAILYYSEEILRIWGFDRQQVIPNHEMVRQRIHPEDRGRVRERAEKAMGTKTGWDDEFRIVLPDGTVKHIYAIHHPVFGASGGLIEVVGTHVDITERKRAEEVRLEERVAERTRIARDLHDTLLQSFQGLLLRLQAVLIQIPTRPERACEILESALGAAEQAIAEGRSAIQELRSGAPAESSLEQMLLALGRELASSQNAGDSAPPLRVIVEGNRRAKRAVIRDEVHRIARELLRNAYLHAHARNIEAELRYNDDAFLLAIRDDGKGIDPKILKDHGRAGHWGLPGIYERAEGMGARLDIRSEVDSGTEVRLTVPASIAYERSGDMIKMAS